MPAVISSVLSDGTIRRLVEEERIKIRPWDPSMVQPASVDLRLGTSFRVFHNHRLPAIDLAEPPTGVTEHVQIEDNASFVIHPGEFVLGSTVEWVELPGRHRGPNRGQVEPRSPGTDRARHSGVR